MGVERESCAYLFSEISTAVMTGGKFKVHASPFSIARFVFDSNVGFGNLSSDDPETVPLGDGVVAVGGAVFVELCEIAVEVLRERYVNRILRKMVVA
jgi:hypothetical protein